MHRRLVLGLAVVVAVLLPASLLGFGLTYHPYDLEPPRYAVAHESTAAFDDAVDRAALDTGAAVAVADLSPEAQSVLEDARSRPPASDRGSSGWQRLEVTVCHERLLVCDAFETAPEFPVHGQSHDDSTTTVLYAVVETDDGLYVTMTEYESSANLLHIVLGPGTLLSVLVFSTLLTLAAHRHGDDRPAAVLGCAGYGLFVLSWPYLVVATGIDLGPWVLLPLTWAGILLVCYHLERARTGR